MFGVVKVQMTSLDVAQRVASAYAHYGDSCWALHQSGRDAECESYDQLCARLLDELRAVDSATAFGGLLLVFATRELAAYQLLAADLLLRGRFRGTGTAAGLLDAVLRFDDYISAESVAEYMGWAFGVLEALAAVRERQAGDPRSRYYLAIVENILASPKEEEA
jgi:hypothetical protein